mgnify:CR=1 FL=1
MANIINVVGLSKSYGRKVVLDDIDFEIEGKDTCADKKIIEEIKTPIPF